MVKPKKLEEHSENKVKRKEEDKKVMWNNYFLNFYENISLQSHWMLVAFVVHNQCTLRKA
jgi:hypothetical protein